MHIFGEEKLILDIGNMVYKDLNIDSKKKLRFFSNDLDFDELKWHRDLEKRLIVAESETDWLFQFEDSLPISLNAPIFIKSKRWHRLIKGTGDLILKITTIDDE